MALVVKNPPVNAGDIRDSGSIPGSGRPLEEGGHGNPLQLFLPGGSHAQRKGAWPATVLLDSTTLKSTAIYLPQ